jgi:hypothetical protein
VPILKSRPKKKQESRKNQEELMSEATQRLMRGIKDHAKKTGQKISAGELRRQGYPASFIAQFETA